MSSIRRYNDYTPYDRLKLPRNKYGIDYQNVINTGSSLFGGGSSSGSTSVGNSMVDLKDFKGATIYDDGERGLVPAPSKGEQFKFLQATGAWIDIPAYRWFKEFPASDGLEKSGLEIEGDLSVTENLYVKNLQAEQAHFWSLVINEVKSNAGQLIVSPGNFRVDFVGDFQNYYVNDTQSPMYQILTIRDDIYKALMANNIELIRCRRLWQRRDDGSKSIFSELEIGDMMRCRQWNIQEGEYQNVSNNDYWSFIVNTGTGTYTNDLKEEVEGIYIDLAFTLRDFDHHNYPLGTTLYINGNIVYPNGYEEVTGALELKQTSKQVLTGLRDEEEEYFENEEWITIQENVIKIRGLDDQIEDITGEGSSNKLYSNQKFLNKAQSSLEVALYGTSSLVQTDSVDDLSSLILNGTLSDSVDQEVTGVDYDSSLQYTNEISGQEDTNTDYLKVDKTVKNTLKLKKLTYTPVELTAGEDITYWDENTGQTITQFSAGDTIPQGTLLLGDAKVIDLEEVNIIKDQDDNVITGEEAEEINNLTAETATNNTRDEEEYINRVYSDYWLFGYVGDYSKFKIREDDQLACLGNLYNENRQNAIVISSSKPIDKDLRAPAIAQYDHINLFGELISRFRKTSIASNGNEFMGSFLVDYNGSYLDINEKINMLITDVTTGLEQVGIHLDGENSTITMVGGVDLRQHGYDNSDKLRVYDSLDTMRVEITPEEIAAPGTSGSQIDTSKKNFNYVSDKKNIPVEYLNCTSKRIWDFWPFASHYMYTYTFDGYNPVYTTSVSLGYLQRGWKLDFRDLNLELSIPAYMIGTVEMTDRGFGKQQVTTLRYTLKRNGYRVSTSYENVNLLNNTSITGLNSSKISTFNSMILDNYEIQDEGTYSIDITLGVKTYGYLYTGSRYDNYYITVKSSLKGTCGIDISRYEAQGVDYDGYKMVIGTNGLSCMTDNSRYFHVGKEGVLIRWDDAYIEMNDTVGLRLRHFVRQVDSATTLNVKYDIVKCTTTGSVYTVTLPPASDYGQGRTLTIIGFNGLTVSTGSSNSHIEIPIDGTVLSIDQFTFSLRGPIYSVQLMAIGNGWYATSVC